MGGTGHQINILKCYAKKMHISMTLPFYLLFHKKII